MSNINHPLIIVEGPDGAGKSTIVSELEIRLMKKSRQYTVRRQPGGTPIGERLRDTLLSVDLDIHPETQALMMMASRCEYFRSVVESASDCIHITDRLEFSTMFYQGAGVYCDALERGHSKDTAAKYARQFIDFVLDVGENLAKGLQRKYILVDAPDAVLNERRYGGTDRYESQTQRYTDKVRAYYRQAAQLGAETYPTEFYLVSGEKPLTEDQWFDLVNFVTSPAEQRVNLKKLYKDKA